MNGQRVCGDLRDSNPDEVSLVCPRITGGVGGLAHYVLVI